MSVAKNILYTIRFDGCLLAYRLTRVGRLLSVFTMRTGSLEVPVSHIVSYRVLNGLLFKRLVIVLNKYRVGQKKAECVKLNLLVLNTPVTTKCLKELIQGIEKTMNLSYTGTNVGLSHLLNIPKAGVEFG